MYKDPEIEQYGVPSSYYARTPSDLRLCRGCLGAWQWNPLPVKALYFGCGFGDDYFSWLHVGTGRTMVEWTACDWNPTAVKIVQALVPGERVVRGNGLDLLDGMKIIVANRIYKKDTDYNANLLGSILAAPDAQLIFSRGHYLSRSQVKAIAQEHGWGTFVYRSQAEDVSPESEGFVFCHKDIATHTAEQEVVAI